MNSVTTPDAGGEYSSKPSNQIYVIDDDVVVRRSLHFVLETAGYLSWPFASAMDFLENLPDLAPAPILLDVRMPNIDGIQLMTMLSDRGIDWPIIIMTAHGDIPVAVQTIKMGAIEFLEKPFELNALELALHAAINNLSSLTQAAKIRQDTHHLFDLLTPREVEVIMALMEGLSNKATAYQLSLSVRTVEMHRANALIKLKVRSIAEAISLAGKAGVTLTARKSLLRAA